MDHSRCMRQRAPGTRRVWKVAWSCRLCEISAPRMGRYRPVPSYRRSPSWMRDDTLGTVDRAPLPAILLPAQLTLAVGLVGIAGTIVGQY